MAMKAIWGVEEVAAYLRTNLPGRRGLSPGTVRRWAGRKLIPANRGRDHRWYFEPGLVIRWVEGGPILHEFHLAKNPRRAISQIRDLVAYLCRPVNQEGNPFLEAHQENLMIAIRIVIHDRGYLKIRQTVRDLCTMFRDNPGLKCLEAIPGLFS